MHSLGIKERMLRELGGIKGVHPRDALFLFADKSFEIDSCSIWQRGGKV